MPKCFQSITDDHKGGGGYDCAHNWNKKAVIPTITQILSEQEQAAKSKTYRKMQNGRQIRNVCKMKNNQT